MSETYLETRDGRRFRMNTPEEEAEIMAAALGDPDCQPLTDEDLARMAHTGRSGHPLKRREERVTLDADLLAKFKATGEGWELRVNAALRDWAQTHEIAA